MKRILFILLTALLSLPANSQTKQKTKGTEVLFGQGKYVIELSFQENEHNLNDLTDFIHKLQNDSLSTITTIKIESYTSPEGEVSYNNKLAKRRSQSIYDYILSETSVSKDVVTIEHSGIDWDGLKSLVAQSDMKYRDEVVSVIENVPEETWRRVQPTDRWKTLVDSRNKHLMDLKYGIPYKYIFKNFYPKLRRGSVATIYVKITAPPVVKEEPPIVTPEPEPAPAPQPVAEPEAEDEPTIKPLLAVKTNLLYDALSLFNVEVEVPIGERWSVACEWMFPWWTSCGNRNEGWQKTNNGRRKTTEILNANIEGKYWFGDRTDRLVMTGWHLGLYGGGGVYDLERRSEGYHGDNFYSVGLSGGYAHTINKNGNLRLEYTLGMGFMKTAYSRYEEHYGIDKEWHTVLLENGKYSWFGPTRARVSLVWMLNHKVK